MYKFNKHISILLLFVFALVLIPKSVVHDIFANHKDTVCDFDHHKGGVHVEVKHTHCELFNANTTLYNHPQISVFSKPVLSIVHEFKAGIENSYFYSTLNILPARAPPALFI